MAVFLSIFEQKKTPWCIFEAFFMDKSTSSILVLFADGKQPFLTDLLVDDQTPNGKNEKKKQTWDDRKDMSVQVADILLTGNIIQQNQGKRVHECSNILQFGFLMDSDGFAKPPFKLKLKNTHFCRVPTCPTCQQRNGLPVFSIFCRAFTPTNPRCVMRF
jgi:hypothetical protein